MHLIHRGKGYAYLLPAIIGVGIGIEIGIVIVPPPVALCPSNPGFLPLRPQAGSDTDPGEKTIHSYSIYAPWLTGAALAR